MQNKCIFFYKEWIFFEVFPLPWFQMRSNKSIAHDDPPQGTYNFSNPLFLLMEHKTEEGNIIGLQISADHTKRGWKGGLLRAGINVSYMKIEAVMGIGMYDVPVCWMILYGHPVGILGAQRIGLSIILGMSVKLLLYDINIYTGLGKVDFPPGC